MSNEYDYNGLYNTSGQPQNGTPQQPQNEAPQQPQSDAARQPQTPAAAQGGYPNVGSSGLNTANTAPHDYAAGGYTPPQQPYQAAGTNGNGYTSTFAGNGNGAYNGYSYASAPQQPQKPRKTGTGKKVLLRVVAGIGVVALGFGGGYLGAFAANHGGAAQGSVVVQQVERNPDATLVNQGSTNGNVLTVAQISAMVQPSVVAITTEQMVSSNTWFGGAYVQSGAGSGVVISKDGYILTCAHVVADASSITVQMDDDTEYAATVVAADTTGDVAVLKIDADNLTPAVIGDSDALIVGEDAIAVGNPLGSYSGTVTNGIVSALNRSVTVQSQEMSLIQTNAAISPGNSGGGLFNAAGELIGIVNARSAASMSEGIGFAIPINSAMEIAQQLIENGSVKRPALGISVYTVSDATSAAQLGVNTPGAYITAVNPGSGAEAAGAKTGDRIVSIDDVVVSSSTEVINYLKNKEVGDTVALQVEREGKLQVLNVTLGLSGTE